MVVKNKIIGLLSALFFVTLIGCKDENSNGDNVNGDGPTVISECAGFLSVKVNFLTPVPDNLKIVWRGHIAVDECNNQPHGPVVLEKTGNSLTVSDGGFGYTAPQTLDIQIFDQGNCGSESEFFALDNYVVSSVQPALCESISLEFDE
jgi:hypothetical protein